MDYFDKHFINNRIKGKLKPSDEEGYFDIDGDLDISNSSVHTIPIKIKNISGDFKANSSSLTFFIPPSFVGGTMDLSYCRNLDPISLSDCHIGEDFKTTTHTDLKLIPRFVGGETFLLGCPLVSLEGINKLERPNQIKYISNNPEGMSRSTYRTLFTSCYDFKDYDYIIPLLVTLSNIDDKSEIEKITKGFRSINQSEVEKNSNKIIELLKSGILKIESTSIILKQMDITLYESIDKKIGGRLDLSNSLHDLGF